MYVVLNSSTMLYGVLALFHNAVWSVCAAPQCCMEFWHCSTMLYGVLALFHNAVWSVCAAPQCCMECWRCSTMLYTSVDHAVLLKREFKQTILHSRVSRTG
nr:hypothetical protein BgiMline_006909 [Biomphalaria glabrata]